MAAKHLNGQLNPRREQFSYLIMRTLPFKSLLASSPIWSCTLDKAAVGLWSTRCQILQTSGIIVLGRLTNVAVSRWQEDMGVVI